MTTHNPTLLKPEVLIRFRLDTKATSSTRNPILAPDTWVDFDTAFGPQFQVGTEHKIELLTPPSQPTYYRVSKTPMLAQFQYKPGKVVPMTTLYLEPIY